MLDAGIISQLMSPQNSVCSRTQHVVSSFPPYRTHRIFADRFTECRGAAGANPFAMPYTFLLQSFTAPDLATGWFDAAEIYRAWALGEAVWMQAGTLKDKLARGSFPQWLTETPLWIQLNPYAVRSQQQILSFCNSWRNK